MALLPQPDTTSPGALQMLYQVGAIQHVTSANFLAGIDVGSLSAIRTVAETVRDLMIDLLTSISFVSGWRIVDPTGVSLYEESFPAVASGVRAPSGEEVAAESFSGTLTGKGLPDVGLAQGQCRTVIFLGSFAPSAWNNARLGLTDGDINWTGLRDYLNGSTVIGADHYGTKASFRPYWVPQINAHYQKTYGL